LAIRKLRNEEIILAIGDIFGNIRLMNLSDKKFLHKELMHTSGKICSLEFWQKGDTLILISAGYDGCLVFWKISD